MSNAARVLCGRQRNGKTRSWMSNAATALVNDRGVSALADEQRPFCFFCCPTPVLWRYMYYNCTTTTPPVRLLDGPASASHIRRAQPPTNPLNAGVYFTQPPRRNPAARVLVPGRGMTKPSKRTFLKRPHTSAHSAPFGRQEECTATRRPLGNGAGATPRARYPPTGGTACSERPYASAIGARLVSFVVRRRRQWPVVHALRYA